MIFSTAQKRFGLIILTLLASGWQVVWACDACNYFEYSTWQNRSYLGLFYRYRVFNGYANLAQASTFFFDKTSLPLKHAIGPTPYATHYPNIRDFERFQTWELRGNYSFAQGKWNVGFLVPFQQAEVHWARLVRLPMGERFDSTIHLQGVGDARLGLERLFIFYSDAEMNFRHTVRLGVQVKLPTGLWNAQTAWGATHSPEIQPGNGAWEVLPRVGYQAFYKNIGLDMATSWRKGALRPDDYRMGDAFNLTLSAFYVWQLGENTKLVPSLGGYYEQEEKHRWQGQNLEATGGKIWFGNYGLDFSFGRYTWQNQFQLPLVQDMNGAQLKNAGRFTTGLLVNFD